MKPSIVVFFSLLFLNTTAQDKNHFFALDAHMNQTVLDSSKYILWVHQKTDSNWEWDYYNTWGPLIKATSYADVDGKIRNGRFCLYNHYGFLDSMGEYDHDRKNGSFYKLRSSGTDKIEILMQYDYSNDSLVKITRVDTENIAKKMKDTTTTKESEFGLGNSAWTDYLKEKTKYPDRASLKNIHGQVQLRYQVDENGEVKDIYIQKSVEYSLDQESIQILGNGGKWIPGLKNGMPVKTYKWQPFNY